MVGSVALKPYANCQFDHLVRIVSLQSKWSLKLYCLDSSDCFPFCTLDSNQNLQKKKSVSNRNEMKNCILLKKDG